MSTTIKQTALALALIAGMALAAAPARAASMHAEADSADMPGMGGTGHHYRHHTRARGHYASGYNRPRIFAVTPRGVFYRYSPGIKPEGPGFGVGFSAY